MSNKTRQMNDGKVLVPKLRFPEFRDAGEWEENDLEQLAIE